MTFYPPSQLGSNPGAPQDPALQAFNDITQALRAVIPDNSLFLYVTECKKLSLAIMEAAEITRILQRRREPVDGAAILHQEIQNQIAGLALMRLLPAEDVKKAAQVAGDSFMDALQETPPLSRTGVLVREIEALAADRLDGAAVQQELMSQPLFRLQSVSPEAFQSLEKVYERLADSIPMLLASTNATLAQLGPPA